MNKPTPGDAFFVVCALLAAAVVFWIMIDSKLDKARERELSRRGCSTVTHVDMYGERCKWDKKGNRVTVP